MNWIYEHAWTLEIFLVLGLLFALNVTLKKILRQKNRQGGGDWKAHLDYAAILPARVLLWVVFISFSIDLIVRKAKLEGFFLYIPPLRNVAIIVCVAWFLLRWKQIVQKTLLSRKAQGRPSVDPLSLEMLGRIFTIAVLFITAMVVMALFGLDIAPLMTFGGIGAAALGLASKDGIANFFGSLMLSMTRPFGVGDFIELPDKKISGQIEEIGWYFTSIRDVQKRAVYLPNSMFTIEPLINQSRITHRMIEEDFLICYKDLHLMPGFISEIRAYLEKHPRIDPNQPLYVNLKEFGENSIKLKVTAYPFAMETGQFLKLKEEVLLQVYELMIKMGAQMAGPTLSVLLKKEE